MASGADALLATSLTMCLFHTALWYWGPADPVLDDTADEPEQTAGDTKLFCALQTHDFALPSSDTEFAFELLKAEKWDELADTLAKLGDSERQGFYASFDYGRLNPARLSGPAIDQCLTTNSLIKLTNAQPNNADAHVLYGHFQLCEAKRAGLQPGEIQNADSAAALAIAFRHFRLALRIQPDDPEALCGLILAKGFTGLSDDHIEQSLQKLLEVEPLHFHGLMAAGCFLVKSTAGANRFVSVVERTVGEKNVTSAFARIVAHVECMIGIEVKPSLHSRMIPDLHAQLRVYHRESVGLEPGLGQWQQGICNNVIAFAFEKIGDNRERALYLDKVQGALSPYPWQRAHARVNEDSVSSISRSTTSV